ncbi:HlyD family type I secretion periplasmic adaptor subunit [Devosia sp. PTR5]|uniref:Membrane fusion protein (MFP) family protein n=1 Tax=Devosia oryzisoli TaxID=2774138 RepID=A0A927FZ78_9HYPH|nr:HlyD family type I secretion periplasmic adaptor subunit [Devosia oryzisoli]MBD8066786.1 HlyD family type I secretion periplasmic adaptor subunit [Devosia oryzisoli]
MSARTARRPSILRPSLAGVAVISVFFAGMGGWAATAPLSAAAHAGGQIRVESYRKTVQHLEGGVVRDILVREGDLVEAGQELLRLDDVQAKASFEIFQAQMDALLVTQARLVAERDGGPLTLPETLAPRAAQATVAAALDSERRLLEDRRSRLANQRDLLDQQVAQHENELTALAGQRRAIERQIALVQSQTETVGQMIERGAAPRSQLVDLEKEMAQLEGARGELETQAVRVRLSIGEARMQIVQQQSALAEDVSTALRDTQAALAEASERLRAAQGVLGGTVIFAPSAGRVLSMQKLAPGSVVKPGESILDIVPEDGQMVVEAKLSPYDIDVVRPGQQAEIKLMSFEQRRLPLMLGSVRSISADALVDARTGQSYYTVEVVLPESELDKADGLELYPGMPADVMIQTQSRTALEYLLGPVKDSFRRAMRES